MIEGENSLLALIAARKAVNRTSFSPSVTTDVTSHYDSPNGYGGNGICVIESD